MSVWQAMNVAAVVALLVGIGLMAKATRPQDTSVSEERAEGSFISAELE